MDKLIAAITTAIALTACGGNGAKDVVPKDQKLPLTYHFDEKELRDDVGFKGKIIFDGGCFYSDFYGSRMAIVFPHTFRWNKSLNIIEANSKTIKSGQKVIAGGAVIIDRNDFTDSKRHFIYNKACLTEKLILLHGYFE